ncbi:hypothetical protein SAMN05661008_00834 [Alkalithermobacter thermoalcaliphilus JW-YL-7 = DSM 7308]|uniref:Membrane protein n=1 Tax=Alkalithermobacter thermoalcaliphilus JW-YL-7 = DSM 7308 TaxID=1121328 RepID=A0A150FQR1_CLOPD|nr:membrane protein [[Clostridium] paradoxum JW-YL-7 = DSM 7308]SHK76209.1 hypothetical protein SAMN05661008_00834 [[Clostridium] paradoxum JW-YL-7 = DSM 7308]
MKKRFFGLFLAILFILNVFTSFSYADTNGKVILVVINRTSLENMLSIDRIKQELNDRGYIGLMNIRGSRGTSDVRSYATIGSGTRAYINYRSLDFQTLDEQSKKIYERRTGKKAKYINNLNINTLRSESLAGEYSAVLGALGTELKNNDLRVSVIGNADTDTEQRREICLIGMDENGQIENGNIDFINIDDNTMPFGIKTDYKRLIADTKKFYDKSDLLVVELGDTYRLDLYRNNLNLNSYNKMKEKIYDNISGYLDELFNIASENDRIYILSPYPTLEHFRAGYRLSPVIVFEKDSKGILASSTTRRKGLIGNVDIPVDILEYFGKESPAMIGRTIQKISKDNNIDFLNYEYEKIVSTYNIRIPTLYTYAVFQMIVWIIALLAIFMKKKIPKQLFNAFVAILKFTLVIPFVLLIEPILNLNSELSIILAAIGLSFVAFYIVHKFVKDDLNKITILSSITFLGILIDAATGQNMIKNSLLGYDPIIGARYYGIGNEYMGVLIGSIILSLSSLLEKNKISKLVLSLVLFMCIFILGHPKMGANVGGTITAVFAFTFLILKVYDVKVDIKKIILILTLVVLVVGTMAFIDINFSKSQSHLGGAIQDIITTGPIIIIQIIRRKIEMNLRLIGVSIWSKVLILGVIIVGILFNKPSGILKKLCDIYPNIEKGWQAIIAGSIVGFLVNDSGVVAAATSILYVIVPVLLLIMKDIDKLKSQE